MIKKFFKIFTKYYLIGAINFILNIATFSSAYYISNSHFIALMLSITQSYFFKRYYYRKYLFENIKNQERKFILSYLGLFFINYVFLDLIKSNTTYNIYYSQILYIFVVSILIFIIYNFIFKNKIIK